MSGRRALNKGKRGEREVVKLLQEALDEVTEELAVPRIQVGRNHDQWHLGGFDIKGLEWCAIEVKYQEQFNVAKWWEQCKAQAVNGRIPILFYRKNNVKWRVRMFGYLSAEKPRVRCPVEIDLYPFLVYFKSTVKAELKNNE